MKDPLRWILEDCENLTLGVLLLSAMIIFSIVTATSIIVLFSRLLSGVQHGNTFAQLYALLQYHCNPCYDRSHGAASRDTQHFCKHAAQLWSRRCAVMAGFADLEALWYSGCVDFGSG